MPRCCAACSVRWPSGSRPIRGIRCSRRCTWWQLWPRVPGKAGLYRMVMPDKVVNEIYDLAKANHMLLFVDIQTGHENIRTLLPRFEWILKNPDAHLGMDPEFNLCAYKAQ